MLVNYLISTPEVENIPVFKIGMFFCIGGSEYKTIFKCNNKLKFFIHLS